MLISPHMLSFKHGCLGTVCSFWHFYVDHNVDFVSLCIINGWKGGCVDGWAWVWGLLILGLVGHGHRGDQLPLPGMRVLVGSRMPEWMFLLVWGGLDLFPVRGEVCRVLCENSSGVDCPSPLVLWDSHPLAVGTPSRATLLLWLGCVVLGLQHSRGGK